MQFKKELSIQMIKIDALLQGISGTEVQKRIKWCVILLGYAITHVLHAMSESIQHLKYVINFTTDIPEWLHIGIEKEAYQ